MAAPDIMDMIRYYSNYPTVDIDDQQNNFNPNKYQGAYLDTLHSSNKNVSIENAKIASIILPSLPVTHRVVYDSLESISKERPSMFNRQIFDSFMYIKDGIELVDAYLKEQHREITTKVLVSELYKMMPSIINHLTDEIADKVITKELQKVRESNLVVYNTMITKLLKQNMFDIHSLEQTELYNQQLRINNNLTSMYKDAHPDEIRVLDQIGFVTYNMSKSFLNSTKPAIFICDTLIIKDADMLTGYKTQSNIIGFISDVLQEATSEQKINFTGIDEYTSSLIKLHNA